MVRLSFFVEVEAQEVGDSIEIRAMVRSNAHGLVIGSQVDAMHGSLDHIVAAVSPLAGATSRVVEGAVYQAARHLAREVKR